MDAFNKNLGGNAYGGDYIIDVARHFMETDGTRWVDSDPEERMLEFRERGYKLMLESIKSTLDESRCYFDVWFSERSLYEKGEDGTSAVDRALARLDEMGLPYRDEDGALWFRSTALGDDKDRVLIKTKRRIHALLPPTWRTTGTSSSASTTRSTSGAQTTTATSSASTPPARRLATPASWRSFSASS